MGQLIVIIVKKDTMKLLLGLQRLHQWQGIL